MSATSFPQSDSKERALSTIRRVSLTNVVLWAPAAIGVAYFVLFVFRLPQLLERLYWDSDGAVAAVIAETAGEGDVFVGHYGLFTTFWATGLTRFLPFHRELWEYAPYALFVGTMALLVWATSRFAGRWAGAMTATLAIATAPWMSYVSVSLNFHTPAWAGAAICAGYVVWLTRTNNDRRAIIVSVVMAIYSGTTFASDHLYAFVGLVPLFLTAALLVTLREKRTIGMLMGAVAIVSVPIASLTARVMASFNYTVWENATTFASTDQIAGNFGRLLLLIVKLGNGDYFSGENVGLRTALSFGCAVLMLVGTVCPAIALRREFRKPITERSTARMAYTMFWAASVVVLSVAYVVSSVGTQPGYYTMADSVRRSSDCAASSFNKQRWRWPLRAGAAAWASWPLRASSTLQDSKTALVGGLPEVAAVMPDILATAEQEGVSKGYADYWEASSMTWSTDMRLRVQQVTSCTNAEGDALCPFAVNVNSSWFDPSPGKSFVLQDTNSMSMQNPPPASFGEPSATYKFADSFTMYVYPYDVATRIDYSNTNWK